MWVSQGVDAALAGVLGLLIGSFLNVVIYRLPKMLERQWAADCAGIDGTEVPGAEPFNLMVPHSRCPPCPALPANGVPGCSTATCISSPTTSLAIPSIHAARASRRR